MALEQKLTVKLGQRLVMTPSLQQAIKLLQMSKLELVEEVQQELLENPVLEEQQLDREGESDSKDESNDPFDQIDVESYFQDADYGAASRSTREFDPDLPTFEATLSEQEDLTDHLTWQLDLTATEDRIKEIGRAIIGNLDDNGYLKADTDEVQQIGDYSKDEVEAVVQLIQTFDPVGVAARDLRECLLLQIRQLGQDGTVAEQLVRDHIEKLQDPRQYKKLAEAVEIDMDDLQAELEFIRSLDPHPGRKYNAERSTYVVPDVYVVKVDDEYQIMLNEEGLPRLHISPVYRRMLAKKAEPSKEESKGEAKGDGEDAREYVQRKFRAALRLIKSLEERQRTIYKVATSIVKFQRGFLDYGVDKLRPLVLKDVAEDIGMHESTVSRVVNHKYMYTHRGLYEMRFFFHSGIASRGGADVSSLSVKEKIKKLIKDEDPTKPLSDSAIEKRLKDQGLKIARRTVAKYREEMNIPASSNRRQVFG